MKKIVILSGGTSSERQIALKSAQFFKDNLDMEYDFFVLPEQLDEFLINKSKYQLAIPVFHGVYGEDGKIFAFLDILGIKTTFSSFETHAICLNKFVTNQLVSTTLGIQIPKQYLYKGVCEFTQFPQILKPNRGGSSILTYKVDNIQDFEEKVAYIQKNTDDDILVQMFLEADEYSVPIVAGEILPIMKLEKTNKNLFFDYESKYSNSLDVVETWPKIEENLEKNLKSSAKLIYDFLNCRGCARIDFLVVDNQLFFLEVNTIPGMTDASILPKSWALTKRDKKDLVKKILDDLA